MTFLASSSTLCGPRCLCLAGATAPSPPLVRAPMPPFSFVPGCVAKVGWVKDCFRCAVPIVCVWHAGLTEVINFTVSCGITTFETGCSFFAEALATGPTPTLLNVTTVNATSALVVAGFTDLFAPTLLLWAVDAAGNVGRSTVLTWLVSTRVRVPSLCRRCAMVVCAAWWRVWLALLLCVMVGNASGVYGWPCCCV